MFFQKDIELVRKEGLFVKDLPNKGRGLFCKQDIKEGEIIEVTPSYIFDHEKCGDFLNDSNLSDYIFHASREVSKSLKAIEKYSDNLSILPLGISLMCNHSPHPNAIYRQIVTRYTIYFELKAKLGIPKNTEICISYGNNWFTKRKFS